MTARGTCERCGTAVIGDRADRRVWEHCVCVGCLPPAPKLPLAEVDWVVEIYGYSPEIFKAKSAKQAQYRALVAFREAYGRHYTFADLWARGIKTRRATWDQAIANDRPMFMDAAHSIERAPGGPLIERAVEEHAEKCGQ